MRSSTLAAGCVVSMAVALSVMPAVGGAKAPPKPVAKPAICNTVTGWTTDYSGYLGNPAPNDLVVGIDTMGCTTPWDAAHVLLSPGSLSLTGPADFVSASITANAYVGEGYPGTTIVVTSSSQLVTKLDPFVKKNKCAAGDEQWTLSGKVATSTDPVMAGAKGGSVLGKVGSSVKFSWCVTPYQGVELLGGSIKL